LLKVLKISASSAVCGFARKCAACPPETLTSLTALCASSHSEDTDYGALSFSVLLDTILMNMAICPEAACATIKSYMTTRLLVRPYPLFTSLPLGNHGLKMLALTRASLLIGALVFSTTTLYLSISNFDDSVQTARWRHGRILCAAALEEIQSHLQFWALLLLFAKLPLHAFNKVTQTSHPVRQEQFIYSSEGTV
jgi:hypothetical protein